MFIIIYMYLKYSFIVNMQYYLNVYYFICKHINEQHVIELFTTGQQLQ